MTGNVFCKRTLVAILLTICSVNCAGKIFPQKLLAGFKLESFGRSHSTEQPRNKPEDAPNAKAPEIISRVAGNAALMFHGAVGVVEKVYHSAGLVYKQRKAGLTSITFEEFNYIDNTMSDASRAFTRLTWAPLGKKWFYFSNFALPLVSSNPLATFWDHPSTFLSTENQQARTEILSKKRMQAAVQALTALQEEQVLLDVRKNALNEKNSRLVEHALQQPSLAQALDVLEPLLATKASSAQMLQVRLPGALAKQCLQALGVVSVPNLPVLRMANSFRLRNRVGYIRKSDDFLVAKGLSALSPHEVKLACFERCISTEDRADDALREDLSEWLQLVRPSPASTTLSTTTSITTNTSANTKPGISTTTAHPTTTIDVPASAPTVGAGATNATLPSVIVPPVVSASACGGGGFRFGISGLLARLSPASKSKLKVTGCTGGAVGMGSAGIVGSVGCVGCVGSDGAPVLPTAVSEESVVCVPPQHTPTVVADATIPSSTNTHAFTNTTSSVNTLPQPEPPLPKFTTMPALLLSQVKLPTLNLPPKVSTVAASLQPKLAELAHKSMSKVDSVVRDWRVKQKKNSEIVPNFHNKRLAMMALHSLKGLRRSPFGGVYRAALRVDVEVSGDVVGTSSNDEGTGEKV